MLQTPGYRIAVSFFMVIGRFRDFRPFYLLLTQERRKFWKICSYKAKKIAMGGGGGTEVCKGTLLANWKQPFTLRPEIGLFFSPQPIFLARRRHGTHGEKRKTANARKTTRMIFSKQNCGDNCGKDGLFHNKLVNIRVYSRRFAVTFFRLFFSVISAARRCLNNRLFERRWVFRRCDCRDS
jgi:hypothetical protein